MNKNKYDFILPDSVLKTQAMFDSLHLPIAALEMNSVYKTAIDAINFSGVSAALKNYASISANVMNTAFSTKALLGFTDTFSMLATERYSSIVESIIPLVDTSCVTIPQIDWSWLSEAYTKSIDQDESENLDEVVTPEIRSEIAVDITEVLSHPDEAGDISQSKYTKWKEQHPVLADLYMQVLLPLIQAILYGLITFGAATLIAHANKNSRVYEEPASTANIVCNVTVEQSITIVGDVPYFYEVELSDPETGNIVTGYIYKGNLIINSTEEPTIEVNETDVNTEISELVRDMPEEREHSSELDTIS